MGAPREKSHEVAALLQAQRAEALAQVRTLKVRLQHEHDKRVKAEAATQLLGLPATPPTVRATPGDEQLPTRVMSATATPVARMVTTETTVPEKHPVHRKSTKQERLAAAQHAVAEAKAAIRKAGALAHEAATSSTLART